ncbi:hypothetical protein GCM10022284_48270 [Streptomyces hundungensis]
MQLHDRFLECLAVLAVLLTQRGQLRPQPGLRLLTPRCLPRQGVNSETYKSSEEHDRRGRGRTVEERFEQCGQMRGKARESAEE